MLGDFWTIPLSAVLLREKVDRRSVSGVAVALVGIALIVVKGRDGRPSEGMGIALGLASGITYAIVIVGLRSFRDLDATWLASFVNLAGAGFLGLWMMATSGTIAAPALQDWPLLIGFGVVQMGLPYVLFARGLHTVQAPEAALITLLEPALNPVWVWLRHGERPADATMIGGLILMIGVAVRYRPCAQGRPKPIRSDHPEG